MTTRLIRPEERNLICHLLKLADYSADLPESSLVTDLDDGGMGSLEIFAERQRLFGRELIVMKYIDIDNVDVWISINLDDQDDLFELDVWKVNFERLLKFPTPEELLPE
ncbi:hypothetical protein [Pedobacter sp. SYSU D00535]|uniref:DUF6984 family protein n=1 Tax=Pedobacter sp. SYSU D00535 TaxID=2810308 RepID=UPI001A95C7EA|nr:hypothetical protein [Pedobacter sp. SYSU D00535]